MRLQAPVDKASFAGMRTLVDSARILVDRLSNVSFPEPVAAVYRPLEYAWEPHCRYLERYGTGCKRVLFLGMNPGPFGMAQTGIPFGEVAAVRDWMRIGGRVGKPEQEHPKRPVDGFGCLKSEVSGRRLWGLFASRYPEAEDFFAEHFVMNYCPLVWMTASGANLTPDKLAAEVMRPVEAACQDHLVDVIRILNPGYLVGVGAFAMERLQQAARVASPGAKVGKVLHPSPASPAANRGWADAATRQLCGMGVWPG